MRLPKLIMTISSLDSHVFNFKIQFYIKKYLDKYYKKKICIIFKSIEFW